MNWEEKVAGEGGGRGLQALVQSASIYRDFERATGLVTAAGRVPTENNGSSAGGTSALHSSAERSKRCRGSIGVIRGYLKERGSRNGSVLRHTCVLSSGMGVQADRCTQGLEGVKSKIQEDMTYISYITGSTSHRKNMYPYSDRHKSRVLVRPIHHL